MKSKYLICYDIADPLRLRKVFKVVKSTGIHLQYSVFQCSLTWPELQRLKEEFFLIIDPDEDDIRIYPLPGDGKVITMGRGGRIPEGVDIHI